jgi:putative DNA primase/helicase
MTFDYAYSSYTEEDIMADEELYNIYQQQQSSDQDGRPFKPTKPTPLSIQTYDQMPIIESRFMPKVLADRVFDIATRMNCPPEFPYTALMISIATLIGTKLGVYPKKNDPDFYVSSTLWGMIIGKSGSMKTPAQSIAMQKIQSLHNNILKESEGKVLAHKKAIKRIQTQINRHEKNGGNLDEIHTLNDQLEDLYANAPALQTIIVNDATREALHSAVANTQNGVLLKLDEIKTLFNIIDKFGSEAYRQTLLEFWNGTESLTSLRVGSGHTYTRRGYVSILGGIQPKTLMNYIKTSELKGTADDGFLYRFQLTFHPQLPPFKDSDNAPNMEIVKELGDIMEFLLKWDSQNDPNKMDYRSSYNEIVGISFDPQAQVIFSQWYEQLMTRIRSDSDHSKRVDFDEDKLNELLSKYAAIVCKIALVYHAIEAAPKGEISGFISKLNLLRAIVVSDILEEHGKKIYASGKKGGDGDTNLALMILLKYRSETSRSKAHTSGMSVSNISRDWFYDNIDKSDIEDALELLINHGWLESQFITGSNRPTTKYKLIRHVHPYLLNEEDYLSKSAAPQWQSKWDDLLQEEYELESIRQKPYDYSTSESDHEEEPPHPYYDIK